MEDYDALDYKKIYIYTILEVVTNNKYKQKIIIIKKMQCNISLFYSQ